MIDIIKRLMKKYRELIFYVISGGITTAVDFAVFFIAKNIFEINYIIANIIAWALAVITAFVINKTIVFNDKSSSTTHLAVQFLSFAALRILSLVAETGLLYICVDKLHFNEDIVKIAVSVVVVALNYVFSKLFIFKKKNQKKSED